MNLTVEESGKLVYAGFHAIGLVLPIILFCFLRRAFPSVSMMCVVFAAALYCTSCEHHQRRVHAADFHTGMREQARALGWLIVEEKGGTPGVAAVNTGKPRERRETNATYKLKKAETVRTIAVKATADEISAVSVDGTPVYQGKSIALGELLALCFPT